MKINVNCHSSIQIGSLFFDPYKTESVKTKADYIFITHPHYDHLSVEDISRVVKSTTTFIAPKDAKEALEKNFPENNKIYVLPNETYNLAEFEFETFPSYNTNKNFHPRENNWVGYKVILDGTTYAVTGDTDATKELEKVNCDVLFLPIGGTYTMTAEEAAGVTNIISPKMVVPTHYGAIVGTKKDAKIFASLVSGSIKVKELI